MINNRQQSGRRRGRGGQRPGGGGGGGQGQGRPEGGNRIDNRARGNASQLHEKYKNLAADAQRQGDRVNTEYYLQFADHYFRVLSESRSRFEDQQPRGNGRDDRFDAAPDDDTDGDEFGDEGETIRPGEQMIATDGIRAPFNSNGNGQGAGQGGGQANGNVAGGQPREYEVRGPRRDEQDRRPPRDDQDRRPQRADQDRRPRREEEDRRPRRDDRERAGQFRADSQPRVDAQAPAAAEPQPFVQGGVEPDLPLVQPQGPDQGDAQPRRRGRPRKEPVQAEAPAAFDADRLPPALGAPANDADEPAEVRPRRRRVRSVDSPAAD